VAVMVEEVMVAEAKVGEMAAVARAAERAVVVMVAGWEEAMEAVVKEAVGKAVGKEVAVMVAVMVEEVMVAAATEVVEEAAMGAVEKGMGWVATMAEMRAEGDMQEDAPVVVKTGVEVRAEVVLEGEELVAVVEVVEAIVEENWEAHLEVRADLGAGVMAEVEMEAPTAGMD